MLVPYAIYHSGACSYLNTEIFLNNDLSAILFELNCGKDPKTSQ